MGWTTCRRIPGRCSQPHLEAIREAPDSARGQRLVAEAMAPAMRSLQEDWGGEPGAPAAAPAHRQDVRAATLVERSFAEKRRRAKGILRFGASGSA